MLEKVQNLNEYSNTCFFLFEMAAEGFCRFCHRTSQFKCGNCLQVPYCSKEHQKQDWKNHKVNCHCFKIETNEKMGRCLVATRNISEGEVIIKEQPLVAGPSQVTPPVCLGCYRLLSDLNARACSTCGWPVCSEACEKSPAHRPECEITSKHKNGKVKINTFAKDFPHPSYQCITVLRCLFLKEANPNLWKKLMELESHSEKRKSTVKYESDQLFIANFIPKFLNFSEFSNDEMLKVAGIVQVNAHEIPLTDPGYIAIYKEASLLEHNCRANCMKSFTNNAELVIRAAGEIQAGAHLSICYTDPMWGREMRINHLMETKFFICQCERCRDATEFGTHFNSFKCFNRKCEGYAIPSVDTSKVGDSNKIANTWKCENCDLSSPEKKFEAILSEACLSLSNLNKKDVELCKKFLQKYKRFLHPNHHFMVNVKLALIDLLGWQHQLTSVKDKDLEWMLNTCKSLHNLATSLVPAENRLRGVLLFQLHFVLAECGRRKAATSAVNTSQIYQNLMECRDVLTQAYKLLRYEPDELPEGKMAAEAKKALENLEEYLRTLRV